MLVELALGVGHIGAATQMIGVIEVAVLLNRCLALGVGPGFILLHHFAGKAAGAGVDVFGADLAVSYGEVLVYIDRLALGAAFDDSLALVVVFVRFLVAVVEEGLNTVLFVPDY